MSRCIRCRCHYAEPDDEQGDHDCPRCGLTPETRARVGWVYEDEEDREVV